MPDTLTPGQRSYCMSRVKNKHTDLERLIASKLRKSGLRFKTHATDLPGTPDIVFYSRKVAVFIDGDFWHGYRFPVWEQKLSAFWREKISSNRRRDLKNFRKIRSLGWKPIRLWQHQIKNDCEKCVSRILEAIEKCKT